jgi:hypothetical protein
MSIYFDEDLTPQVWTTNYSSDDHVGIAVEDGDSNLEITLSHVTGVVQHRFDSRREIYIDGPRHMEMRLTGVAHKNRIAINYIHIDGVSS